MASAGERCHISVWLSESFCILNLVRQDFSFIALLRGEEEMPRRKNSPSAAGAALGQQERVCPRRAAAEGTWPRRRT